MQGLKNKSINLYALSFIFGMGILFLCFAEVSIFPFGDKAFLTVDISHQYADFYSFLRQSVLSDGNNLIFSLKTALGGDTIGLTSYYLLSPLNFIIILFPEKYILEAVLFITLLKSGLCASCFAFFINKKYPSLSFGIKLSFSLMYCFSAFFVVYGICPMWLDGVILLPLLIVFLEKLIYEQKPTLYCIFLILTILSNYYIGFMICIFLVLYVIGLYINKPLKIRQIISFFGFSALCGACCAVVLLPSLFAVLSGRGGYYDADFSMYVKFSLPEFLSKLYPGYSDTIKTTDGVYGLPNIYSGIICVFGIFVFFFNKNIKLRERIGNVVILAVIVVSMFLNPLDLIWHGFNAPYWYPYRYSFLFSFTAINICIRGLSKLENLNKKRLYYSVAAALLIFAIGACATPFVFVVIAFLFIITYLLIFYKKISMSILSYVLIIEASLSTFLLIYTIDDQYNFEKRESYTQYVSQVRDIIKSIDLSNNIFRIEKTFARSRNDNMSLYINGISHYSSSFNEDTNSLIKNMGFMQSRFWTKYKGATPFSDSIFSIKYIISKDENSFYKEIDRQNGYILYKNPYALGIAFETKEIENNFITYIDPFLNQQNYINSIIENNYSIYKKAPFEKEDMTYSVTVSKTGHLYMYLYSQKAYSSYIYVNGEQLCEYFRAYIYPENNYNIVDLGYYEQNDIVEVEIRSKSEKSFDIDFACFYTLDIQETEKALSNVNDYEVTESKAGEYIINVKNNQSGFVSTTIPYYEDFEAYINGKKIQTFKNYNAFLAFEVPEGDSVVIVKYKNKWLEKGAVTSAISILILISVLILNKYFFKKVSA